MNHYLIEQMLSSVCNMLNVKNELSEDNSDYADVMELLFHAIMAAYHRNDSASVESLIDDLDLLLDSIE